MNDLTPIEQSQLNHAPIQAIDPMVRMIEAVVQNPDLPMERLQALMEMKNAQEKKHAEQAFNFCVCNGGNARRSKDWAQQT